MKKNSALITQPTALYIFCKKKFSLLLNPWAQSLQLLCRCLTEIPLYLAASIFYLSSSISSLGSPFSLLASYPSSESGSFFVTGDLCQQSTFLSPFIWCLMTFFMFTYMSPSGVWSRSRRVAQRSTSWRSWWWGSIVLLTMLTMLWKLWKFWQNWQCWKFWQSLQCWQRWQC